MKEKELRKKCDCASCNKPIGSTGIPLFWTIKINRFGLDVIAIKRQAGLEMMMGNVAIAQVMSPDEDMAKPVMEEVELTICEVCMSKKFLEIIALAEQEESCE